MPPENEEVSSIREDLEAAFEQHTPDPAPEETGRSAPDSQEPVGDPAPSPEGGEPEAAPEQSGEKGRKRGPDGKFVPADDKKPGQQPDKSAAPPAASRDTPPPEQPADKEGGEPLPPPVGWKPDAREHWKEIPRRAQEEIVRRERETAQALSLSKNSRQFYNDFNKVVGPFTPLIQAQNSTPLQAVHNLMTTAAGLAMGNAEQKARIVREIIQNYGVDIETLDKVLAGTPVNPQQAQVGEHNTPPQWAQPLFKFMGSVQQIQQQRQAQIRADAEAEADAFAAKHEFFDDVREDMADLMEVAARRGRSMTMEAAYKQAIAMHPELSNIVQQRQAASQQRAGGSVAAARRAASSVSGAPRSVAGTPKGGDSRRDDIAAAWEEAGGR